MGSEDFVADLVGQWDIVGCLETVECLGTVEYLRIVEVGRAQFVLEKGLVDRLARKMVEDCYLNQTVRYLNGRTVEDWLEAD